MKKPKKYYYYVSLSAEGDSSGYIELTKEEAKVVAKATNPANWLNSVTESWSGSFFIDVDNPHDILPE